MTTWIDWVLPPAPTTVERARPEDIRTIAAIHAVSFLHQWSEEELSILMREPNVVCLVARRANVFGTRSAIGFLLLRHAAGEAEVLTIAVDPRRRSRGCGRDLMVAGFRELFRHEVTTIFLEVDAGNAAAVSLYRKLGFQQVGERRGYYRAEAGGSSTALVMRADLS